MSRSVVILMLYMVPISAAVMVFLFLLLDTLHWVAVDYTLRDSSFCTLLLNCLAYVLLIAVLTGVYWSTADVKRAMLESTVKVDPALHAAQSKETTILALESLTASEKYQEFVTKAKEGNQRQRRYASSSDSDSDDDEELLNCHRVATTKKIF